MDKQFFHHVAYDHNFVDAKLFYRFLGDDDKETLNATHGTYLFLFYVYFLFTVLLTLSQCPVAIPSLQQKSLNS